MAPEERSKGQSGLCHFDGHGANLDGRLTDQSVSWRSYAKPEILDLRLMAGFYEPECRN